MIELALTILATIFTVWIIYSIAITIGFIFIATTKSLFNAAMEIRLKHILILTFFIGSIALLSALLNLK